MEIANKVTGSALTASEFNQIPDEMENLINKSGQTASSSDLTQITKAVSQFVADGDFYSTSGTANAIVLSAVSPRLAPTQLTNGFRARFIAQSNNTDTVTININNLGAKQVKFNGTLLGAGDITSGKLYEVVYINNSDTFDLRTIDVTGLVKKSGDTMTGYLIQQRPTPSYFLSSTQITKGTNPDDIKYMSVNFNDKKGNVSYEQTRLGMVEYSLNPNGLSKMRIAAYRNLADSTSTAELNLQIDSSGTASCTFPNTTCCDGQWVNVNRVIASDVNFNTGGSEIKTYSLASYLPDDNYTYEVLFTLGGQTAAKSGASFGFSFNSDLATNVFVCRAITWSAAYAFAYGAAIVPLKTRQIKVEQVNNTSYTPTMTTLRMCAYRRVGTNA